MPEPPWCLSVCDAGQGSYDRAVEGLPRARLRGAQGRLHLGPTRREGRQVRRGGRQGPQTSAASGQGLLAPHSCMCPEMVHPDHIARPQWRTQPRLHRRTNDIGVGRTVDSHARVQAVDVQGPQDGDMRAVGLGAAPDDPLPRGSAAREARQRAGHARVVHARHALEGERGEPLRGARPRRLDARGLACRRVARRLLRGSPRRCHTRHLVGTLTRTPRAAATRGHNASRGASGWSSTNRRTTAWAAGSRRGF